MDNGKIPIISIVTPIYSRPELISEGLDSIYSQGLNESDFEVLAVNNGATDPTVQEVLDAYTFQGKRPSNLRIINVKINKRAGSGRNAGIRAAKGKFILHKDHDDAFAPDSLRKLVEHLRNNQTLDVLTYNKQLRQYSDNRIIEEPCHIKESSDIMSGERFITTRNVPAFLWLIACRRDFVLKNDLFVEEDVILEDGDYVIGCLINAARVQSIPLIVVYYYNYGRKSQNVTSSFYKRNLIESYFQMTERILDWANQNRMHHKDGATAIDNLYKYHYSVIVTKYLWALSYKEIIELLEAYPYRLSDITETKLLAITNPRLYAAISVATSPFKLIAINTYIRIKASDNMFANLFIRWYKKFK